MTIRLPALALTLALAAVPACANGADHASDRAATTSAEPASPSIYPLGLALHDESGATIGVDVFRGHPVIVSMFYGSCPVACPLIVAHIQQVEAELPADVRARTRVLLVSFDPERDTPAALRAMAERHHVDRARWTFATGSDDAVRKLAGALGVSYRKLPGGAFAHDSVITVLDADGAPLARTDDPSPDVAPLAAAVVRATR